MRAKKKATVVQTKKIGRLEQLTEATRKQFIHQNSAVVIAKQELLQFEQAQADRAIFNLTAALDAKKAHRNEIGAKLAGLAEILAAR